ncbi:hypothetical protein PMAYCL1PPCAC_00442 [Pristionchus mayeri]|uniref:Uncharacterized protein n=1 Tax=Pristionchus mayeri TaxID=1317129 RepID=A0AAN4YWG5_9BILA|nr:hypothetical protein PMAYCL1PPCAC_00442 [Pristionchus mayeri]
MEICKRDRKGLVGIGLYYIVGWEEGGGGHDGVDIDDLEGTTTQLSVVLGLPLLEAHADLLRLEASDLNGETQRLGDLILVARLAQQMVEGINVIPALLLGDLGQEDTTALVSRVRVHEVNTDSMHSNLPVQIVGCRLECDEQRDLRVQRGHFLGYDGIESGVTHRRSDCVLCHTFGQSQIFEGADATAEMLVRALLPRDEQRELGSGRNGGWRGGRVTSVEPRLKRLEAVRRHVA